MSNFTLDQLRDHFRGDTLIGRVRVLNEKKGYGLITAFQEDKGEPWRYPDGTEVNDIVFKFTGKTKFEKNDWVLISGYEAADGGLYEGQSCWIQATRVDLLVEVDLLKELIGDSQLMAKRRLLAGAMQSLKIVGGRILILHSYLEKEKTRIEKEFSARDAQLAEWEATLKRKEEDLQTQNTELLAQRVAIQNEKDRLLQAQSALAEREKRVETLLQRYGLEDEASLQAGHIRLSDDLIALLMAQAPVLEQLKTQRIEELAELEQELEKLKQELAQRETVLAEKSQTLSRKEESFAVREEAVARREQSVRELEEILLPTRTPKKPAPISLYEFGDERALVDHLRKYIKDRGFYYDEGFIEDFYTCLKTDYFVILSGISGAGKSKLPELFTEAVGGAFKSIPVRPSWNDDRDLIGFFNPRAGRYQSTDFIEFILQAQEDADRLYIVCLDEMNLAPVEYYFAQFLSVLERGEEERRLAPPDEALTEKAVDQFQTEALIHIEQLESKRAEAEGGERYSIEREIQLRYQLLRDLERYRDIPIPHNIRFVGTVNVDQTTHGFSDKVLDRANVIQFEKVDLRRMPASGSTPESKGLGFSQFGQFCRERPLSSEQRTLLDDFIDQIIGIDKILEPGGLSLGFRILGDVRKYMHQVIQGGYLEPPVAFDFQIKQRILPKIRGMQSQELNESLRELIKFLKDKKYTRSLEKVEGRKGKHGGMMQQLAAKGYVNYWEVR